jgi:hypothetical protein
VTLLGTVVLGLAFFRPLRRRPRLSGTELAVRAGAAVAVVPPVFAVVAGLGRGTVRIPGSALGGLGGGAGGCSSGPASLLGGAGGSGSGLGGLLSGLTGRLFGSGGISGALSTLNFRTEPGSTVLGAAVWVVLVLAVGCVAARRTALPRGIAMSRLVRGWGPGVSAVTGVLLTLMAVLLAVLTFVGVAVGGTGASAAGAVLLVVPNLVLVALTLGVGSPWTMVTGQTKGQSNPLSSLLGNLQGSCGASGRTQDLRTAAAGGFPLWPAALLLVCLVLLVCGYVAAARTPGGGVGASDRGRYSRHLLLAARLGAVTAVLMGVAVTLAAGSGHVAINVFDMRMGGMRADLSGSAPLALVLGLVFGGAAGFAGSLLHDAVGSARRRPRRPAAPVAGPPAGKEWSRNAPVSSRPGPR